MLAGYQLCYFGAIQRVGVAIATLVTLCTAPVIVAVLSVVLLGERPTRRRCVGRAGDRRYHPAGQPGRQRHPGRHDGPRTAAGARVGARLRVADHRQPADRAPVPPADPAHHWVRRRMRDLAVHSISDLSDGVHVACGCLGQQCPRYLAQSLMIFARSSNLHPQRIAERLVSLLSSGISHIVKPQALGCAADLQQL